MAKNAKDFSDQYLDTISEKDSEMGEFRDFLNAAGKSIITQYDYIRYVSEYKEWLAGKGISAIDASPIQVSTFLESFGKDNSKYGSKKAKYYSALKSYYRFLFLGRKVKENPLDFIQRAKQKSPDKVHRVYITMDEFKEMLEEEDETTFTGARNRAILCMFFGTGIRLGALLSLRMSDYDRKKGTITTIEKEDKRFVYHLPQFVRNELENYLRKFRWRKATIKDTHLFIKTNGDNLGFGGVSNIVHAATQRIGKETSPHKLRASFARVLYQQTRDIYQVQRALNHNSPLTTQIYVGDDDKIFEENASIMDNLFDA